MTFPKRDITHIIEKQAVEILTQQLPKEWIIREMTERDYGVDLYVELIKEDKNVTGELIAIQVKGTQNMVFTKEETFTFYSIKESTINYWLHLPIPVFLVVVCIDTKQSYWVNVREANRTDEFVAGLSDTFYIKFPKKQNLLEVGLILFQLNYIREKRWGAIENAMENSLMLFSSFGPFILMCKRKSDEEFCSTTIQYILIQHYEYFYLLSRYVLGKKPKAIHEWYDEKVAEIQNNPNCNSFTFSYKVVKNIIKYFSSDYREAVKNVNLLFVKHHPTYYQKKFPYLYLHLKARPLTFVESDWYSRYYFDEYESDMTDIEKKYFEDFTEYDEHDLLDDLNI